MNSHKYFLLLLTFSFLACTPRFEKSSETLFVLKKASETGVSFNNSLKEDSRLNYMFYQSIYNGAGVAIADLDNDGLEDLYFCGNQASDKVYKNLGGLEFQDVTEKSGINENRGWSAGVAIADIDNDGLKDIYVSRFLLEDSLARKNELYMNLGGMKFEERSTELGLDDHGYSIQSAFLDYDKDGDLDLYLVNQPPNHSSRRIQMKGKIDFNYTDRLFRNDGKTFKDVTEESGITNYAFGLSAICSDINSDGWPDIYVTCDFDEPDLLYINQQDGSFKNMADSQLQHMSNFSMGADIADFNNDGLLDIFTADMVAEDNKRLKTNMSGMNPEKFYSLVDSGYHYQYMFNALQLNRGNGHFSEIAQFSGVSATDWSWTALFSDFDLDGYKDLLVTNGLKRDVRDNDFNIARRKKVRKLQEEAQEQGNANISIDPLELLALSPSTPLVNYAYKNNGNLSFSKQMSEWGLDQAQISHGVAIGDLDNDGDMDLVMNNMDQKASIYENKRESYVDHNWIQLELDISNPEGSIVRIETESGIQIQECLPVRGYMSTSSPILQFGLGNDSKITKAEITWPSGEITELKNPTVNQRLSISPGNSSAPKSKTEPNPHFAQSDILKFLHSENEFDDFETEILLPHRMSTLGPCMCKGDLDGDGLEDLFLGGAKDQSGVVFYQDGSGGFHTDTITASSSYEDTGCLIFDSDGDGWNDLYVVSGGNEERENLNSYQDRLYQNIGSGKLIHRPKLLPEITISGKSIQATDIEGDGDLDLFVGGRQFPGKYPYPVDSKLLVNEAGTFTDRTDDLAPEFIELGMVTDARWYDAEGDGDMDLIIVGEWMPITFFENVDGSLRLSSTVENSLGWWNHVEIIDADGDGEQDDFVLGNLGTNIKYKASPTEPFQIFSDDFDENGSNDIYLAYYQEGNCYPVRGRQCSSQQLPFIKEKFPSYNDFGQATVYDVLGEGTSTALNYKAVYFESAFLIQEEKGYTLQALPTESQFSVVNSSIYADLDKDGIKDLFLSGNQHDREIETTRSDASYGVYMKGDPHGGFSLCSIASLGIYAGTDVREMLLLKGSERNMIIIANNDDHVRAFAEYQVSE